MAGIEIHRALPPAQCVLPDYAFQFIKIREGYVGYAYDDADGKKVKTFITPENAHTVRGKITIGHGRTKGVKPGDTCTPAEAEQWLREELVEDYEPIVRRSVTVPLAPYQYAALVSLVYNRGLIPPSLLACINGGRTDMGVLMPPCSWSEALKQFPRNCRSTILQTDMTMPIKLKQPLGGLYERRMAEAVMFAGFREWDLATSGVRLVANRIRTPTGEWKYEIDANESTSLESVLERAARAASVHGLEVPAYTDEEEANQTEKPGLWPQQDPARVSPVAARETAQPPSPPASSPSVPSPQASAPAVEGKGAGATAIAAPASDPPVTFPPAAGPDSATTGKVGGTIVTKSAAPPAPAPVPMPPTPPAKIVLPSQLPPDEETGLRSIFASKRFYGAFLIVFGRIFSVLNIASYAPGLGFLQTFLSDAVILDGASSAAAWIAGEALMRVGEDKSKGKPLATPREIALATQPKGNA